MQGNADKYEEDEWWRAAEIVLAEERKERNNPRWAPTYLNGSVAYSERVAAKCEELRGNGVSPKGIYTGIGTSKLNEAGKNAKDWKVWNGG